ncbi:MAG: hypothetical protein P4K93_16850 [Terracidiphilus sp.]|nr:hypothetical protein [Terracidiphilus sp.]MDR3799821.1 hypothetical protein [Terracidiphilus sp.]
MAFLLLEMDRPFVYRNRNALFRHTYPLSARPFAERLAMHSQSTSANAVYFGGAGVKISRFEGSGFGFGFGAFFTSFLPLSLFPMQLA